MLYNLRIFGPIASALNIVTKYRTYGATSSKAYSYHNLNSIKLEPAVYKISNINKDCPDYGKVYIGSSVNPRSRIVRHFSMSVSSKVSALNTAIREFGFESFNFEILEYTGSSDIITMRTRENYYLKLYPNKYNVSNNAYSNAGNVQSDIAVLNKHIRKTSNSTNFKLIGPSDYTHVLLATNLNNNQTFSYVSFAKAAKAFNTTVPSIVASNNCIRFFNLVPFVISIPYHQVSLKLQPRIIITIVSITNPNMSFSFNKYTNAATFLGCTPYKLKSFISNKTLITANSLYSKSTFKVSVKRNLLT